VAAVNRPAFQDIVTCGGFDRVLADREDVLAPDCEEVFFDPGSFDEFLRLFFAGCCGKPTLRKPKGLRRRPN
jgi:hypothetical protein